MNKSPVTVGYLCFRIATALSLVLVVALFFLRGERSMLFMGTSLVWMALSAYAGIRILSDMLAGQHTREQRFEASLIRWEDALGTRKQAVSLYVGLTTVLVVVKLAIPFIIQLF